MNKLVVKLVVNDIQEDSSWRSPWLDQNNGSSLIAGIPNYAGIIIDNILNQFLDNFLNAIT